MAGNVSRQGVYSHSRPIPTTAPVVIPMIGTPVPASIAAIVGAGGTLLIEYTLTPITTANWPTSANWTPWNFGTNGVVSTSTFGTLTSPVVAIRVTAATTAGVVEIAG